MEKNFSAPLNYTLNSKYIIHYNWLLVALAFDYARENDNDEEHCIMRSYTLKGIVKP